MAGPKKRRGEAHVRLYRHELESEAYRSLSMAARALLIEFRALYSGGDNRVHMSVREMCRRLGISQRPAQKACNELLDRGFIRLLEKGSFNRKLLHASTFMLTNEPPGTSDGPAPKDYMRWKQKNTVVKTTTDSSQNDYRGTPKDPAKPLHGSRNDYRKPPKSDSHGSRFDYTDRLPWVAVTGTRQ